MATKKNVKVGNNEYYRLRRTIDGKVKAFYGTSKHDAERKYREYLEQLAKRKTSRSCDTATIHDKALEYIENSLMVSQRYANGTKDRYSRTYNKHIKGTWFDKTIASDVRASDIQRFYNTLNVSSSTMSQTHRFMGAFWKWMVLNEYADNVISAVEIPKKPDNKRHDGIVVWEEDEMHTILDALDRVEATSLPVRARFLLYVLIYTGARIGEALSLRYSDFDNGVIRIERQWQLGEIKAPKANSVRSIPMHDALIEPFREHGAWHKEDMWEHGYTTEYVFTTKNGTLYSPQNLGKTFNRFYDEIGVPRKKTHAFRSTFCTQLCRCDVPLEVASKLLGHKSLEVTSRHYQMIKSDTIEDAIHKLKY